MTNHPFSCKKQSFLTTLGTLLLKQYPYVTKVSGDFRKNNTHLHSKISRFGPFMVKSYLCFFISLCLSGCFSPVHVDLPQKYTLDPTITVVPATAPIDATLLVSPIKAAPGLSTQRMAYKQPYQKMAYYIHHEWWAAPNRLLTPVLLQALQKTHYFNSVVDENSTATTHRRLESKLLAFYGDYSHSVSPQFIATLQVNWINSSTGSVIAAQTIHTVEPITLKSPQGEAAAAQQASQHLIEQVITYMPQ